jgi:hypothetical protein
VTADRESILRLLVSCEIYSLAENDSVLTYTLAYPGFPSICYSNPKMGSLE